AAPPSGPLPLAPAAPAAAFPLGAPAALPLAPSDSGVSLPGLDPASLPAPPAADACDTDAPLDCSSPEAFARSIWPHARKAAAELGVDPRALVAQAALETGWGRRLPQDAEGGGHNLFGIKAGASWSGGRAQARTHEYVDGARREEVASFRTYDSPAASFADYVRLLKTSPRYAQALGAGDARRFAGALQRAGYATDPGYAAKIAAIAEGPTLQRALAGVGGAQRG
ncbi:glucosaminidase domain-containing protein, partial [Vulcaniibacterium tengchongense]